MTKTKDEIAARLTYTRRGSMTLKTRIAIAEWLREQAKSLISDTPEDYAERYVARFYFGRGLK